MPAEGLPAYQAADIWMDFELQGNGQAPFVIENLKYRVTSQTENTVEVMGYQTAPTDALTIPATVTYNEVTYTVTGIKEQVFANCSALTSVSLPDGLTSIGNSAFSNCTSLTGITLPERLTTIGSSAFFNCTSLTGITIPNTVTSIGIAAFRYSGLTTASIGNGVTTIGERAFYYCRITEMTVAATVPPTVGTDAFTGCSKSIPVYVPRESLAAYKAADGWKDFTGLRVWWQTTFTEGNLTYGVSDATAKTVELTGYVTKPTGALTIPATVSYEGTTYSVTAIGYEAFYLCNGITEMTVAATVPPTMGTNAFYGVSQSIPVYVPLEALDAYLAADGWKNFTNLQAKGFSSFTVDNLTYRVTGSTAVEVTGYETEPTDILDIPATVTYEGKSFNVTAIKESAFSNCSKITLLTIPNTVKTIGKNAFYLCTGILEVTIPESVTKIGDMAFQWCSGMLQLTLGNGVTEIERGAFEYCKKLQQVTIGNNVTTIGERVFSSCENLKQVTVPESVTSIGSAAFDYTIALTAINVAEGNTAYCSDGGILFNKDKTTLVQYPAGKTETAYAIPDGVTTIGESAFSYNKKLTAVTIPESVTAIGSSAFSGCEALKTITVPDGVTKIEDWTFSPCTALTKVTLGNGVTSIGFRVFVDCSALAELTVTATEPPVVAANAFENVSRDITVYVPAESLDAYKAASVWSEFTNLQPWGQITFTAGNLTYRVTDETAKTAQLTGYATAPEGALTIPAGVEYDGTEYSVTSIGNKALAGCELLTEAVVSNSVATIGNEAFADSKALAKVTLGDGVATMGNAVFRGCESLTEAVIPDGVTTLGAETFSGCTKLSKAVLGNGVKAIGEKTFYGCTLLAEITIPDGVTTIGSEAFSGCTSLAEITIPDGVTTIGSEAFSGCTSLAEITVPDAVTTIGNSAFSGCTKLAAVALGNGVSNIGDEAFSGCTALTEIILPNSVRLIGENAFSGCSALEKATLGSSVRILSDRAFYGCEALAEMTVLATEPPMASANTFDGVSRTIPVYVPKGSLETYRTANVWKEFLLKEPPFVVDNLKYCVIDHEALTAEVIGYVDVPTGTLNIPATVTHDEKEYKVTVIADEAFAGCDAITHVTIGSSVTSIGANAFGGCTALAEINVDGSNTAYSSANGVLFDKAQTALLLYPAGKADAAYTVPDGVTAIGKEAVRGCTALTGLTLPATLTAVGEMAFAECTALAKMTVLATVPPTVSENTFDGVSRDIPVYVPAASLATYQAAAVWNEFNLQATSTAGLPAAVMPESIAVYDGMLHNPQALEVRIFYMSGREVVYRGNATNLTLPTGIYIVRCGEATIKAVF